MLIIINYFYLKEGVGFCFNKFEFFKYNDDLFYVQVIILSGFGEEVVIVKS